MFNAMILAGSKKKGPLEISANVENKALISINNRPSINYIIDALINSKNINKTIIVGPEKILAKSIDQKIDKIVNSGDNILENIENGINYFHSVNSILILTSDIPLITTGASGPAEAASSAGDSSSSKKRSIALSRSARRAPLANLRARASGC